MFQLKNHTTMNSIKIALVVFIGLFIHLNAQAQVEPTPEEQATLTVTKITRGIKSSPERKDSLMKVFVPYYTKLMKVKSNPTEVKKLNIERDAGVKTVLYKDAEYRAYERFLEDEKNHEKQPKAIENLYHGGQRK